MWAKWGPSALVVAPFYAAGAIIVALLAVAFSLAGVLLAGLRGLWRR